MKTVLFFVLALCSLPTWNLVNAATLVIELGPRSFSLVGDEGQVLRTGPISAARKGMVTPKGMFQVRSKNVHGYSKKYHAKMPYAVFFNKNIAVHAGYIPANRAGTSHGCVHLTPADARFVYGKMHVGDSVIVQ